MTTATLSELSYSVLFFPFKYFLSAEDHICHVVCVSYMRHSKQYSNFSLIRYLHKSSSDLLYKHHIAVS